MMGGQGKIHDKPIEHEMLMIFQARRVPFNFFLCVCVSALRNVMVFCDPGSR